MMISDNSNILVD